MLFYPFSKGVLVMVCGEWVGGEGQVGDRDKHNFGHHLCFLQT